MKIVKPQPFTFKGGKKAVLLLHGFTGNTADVRMLGRYLNEKGYTCHAPQYKGHGVPPEELLSTGPDCTHKGNCSNVRADVHQKRRDDVRGCA